jgi:uncharacterized membrane protein
MTIEVFVAIAGVVIFTIVFIASAMYFRRSAALVAVRKPVAVETKITAKPVYSGHH